MRDTFMKRQSSMVVYIYCIVTIILCTHFVIVGEGHSATVATVEPVRSQSEQGKSTLKSSPQELTSASQPLGPPVITPASTVPRAQENKSEFEKYVSGKGPTVASLDISQFGYDLFMKPPSTFAPTLYVPVGPDYVIGPGDTIKIELWGKFEGSWTVVVNNDGNISLPKTGVFGVTGLSFKELKELLHKNLSKYYTGFEMSVSMGALRTIQVYVVGNAQRPGVYTVSSLSTTINALFEGGGPSKTGSMRNIKVVRNGKVVVSFDLYDFLLQGDKSKDLRLMPEDVIFIPPTGPLVGIAGNVKTPAIYELRDETRLLDLIKMSGGLTGIAFTGRVQMQRIEDHHSRIIFEGNLIDIEKNPEKNFILQDGDLVKIFTVVDSTNIITLNGAVAYPGEYGISPGVTRVKDVISMAGGRLYHTSDLAEITRVTVLQSGPKTDIFHIDLAKALEGDPQHNVPLQLNDYLLVRSVPEWSLFRTVSLNGEVRYPGIYTFRHGETLSSLIERAGGFTSRAYLRGTIFTRERVREQQQQQMNEMVERLERELSSFEMSQLATASSADDARMVQRELDLKKHFLAQLKTAKAKGRIALIVSNSDNFKGSTYDIELEQGDVISVPSDTKTVQVIGSVYNQNAYIYEKKKEYDYYVNLAGGYTPNADNGNIFILKANGTAIKAGGGIFRSAEHLNSGDTIVVPEQIERVAWLRNIKDITQIIYQIAVTAGVLLVVR